MTTPPVPVDFGISYRYAMRKLRQQRSILERLFEAASIAEQSISEAVSLLHDVASRGECSAIGNVIVSSVIQGIEQIEAYQSARDIYAATVALVLDDILSSLFADFKRIGGNGDPGPIVEGYSTQEILKALGNNFRHYEEWRRDEAQPKVKQIVSIKVIAAVLHIPIEEGSRETARARGEAEVPFAHHGLHHIMARPVLHEIGGGTYADIEGLVRQSMDAMVNALGLSDNSNVVWARAESQ